ncbi:MAG TPA: hypothetical protein VIK56_13720 [Rhodoferax sp.]
MISALILSLRSVSFAMLLLSFAIAWAVLDTAAFFAAGLAVGLTTLAGVFTFGVAAALGPLSSQLPFSDFLFLSWQSCFCQCRYCHQFFRRLRFVSSGFNEHLTVQTALHPTERSSSALFFQ